MAGLGMITGFVELSASESADHGWPRRGAFRVFLLQSFKVIAEQDAAKKF